MSQAHHAGQDGLAHNEGRHEVDVDYLLIFLHLHLMHGDALDDAGVVDQNVNGAQLLPDVGHHLPDAVLVRHIADIALRVDAQRFIIAERLLQMGLAATIESQSCASLGQCLADGKANAVAAARHKRHTAFQRKVCHIVSFNG